MTCPLQNLLGVLLKHAQAIQGKTSVCLGLLAALRNAGLKAAMLGRDRGGTTAVGLLGLGG
jgi:hypothetical protein